MNITNMTEENIESLFRNTTSYASSMLKKHDKVIMLCKATHLYFSNANVSTFQCPCIDNFVEK